ncbi:hypothetical protein D779_1004 [Imhoffiella purpurea]|uniref:Uncharacterized protein n=1 Tax=Imhoffiella purpurea TaxID=1249627 RepID=W9VZH2_9GAMM|nr:hypothetical protein D779_1004 [Imhoffiella purpurea]
MLMYQEPVPGVRDSLHPRGVGSPVTPVDGAHGNRHDRP